MHLWGRRSLSHLLHRASSWAWQTGIGVELYRSTRTENGPPSPASVIWKRWWSSTHFGSTAWPQSCYWARESPSQRPPWERTSSAKRRTFCQHVELCIHGLAIAVVTLRCWLFQWSPVLAGIIGSLRPLKPTLHKGFYHRNNAVLNYYLTYSCSIFPSLFTINQSDRAEWSWKGMKSAIQKFRKKI